VDVLPLIQHYGDRKQEHFLCISINGANEVMNIRVVTIGLINPESRANDLRSAVC